MSILSKIFGDANEKYVKNLQSIIEKINSFEPEFEKYVWSAPLGQLSDIIQTSNGFHLVVVIDRHVSEADAYETEIEHRADEKGKPQ